MTGDEIITWLNNNNCTVEFKDGRVKVSLKQNERNWSIERESLQEAVESTIYSGCIV